MSEPSLPDRAWIERQAVLGPVYLQFWLSSWDERRELILQYPDLADPTRRAFAKLIALKPMESDAKARAQFAQLMQFSDPVLDRCAEALELAAGTGVDLRDAIARVFADRELAAQCGETDLAITPAGAPDIATEHAVPPAVEVVLALAEEGLVDAALDRAREHLADQEATHGHASLHAADALSLIARVSTLDRARHDEARTAFERALAIRQAQVGELHPLTLGLHLTMIDWLCQVHAVEAVDAAAPLAHQLEEHFAATKAPVDGIASCRVLELLGMAHALAGDPAAGARTLNAAIARLDMHALGWSSTTDVPALRARIADALAAIRERFGPEIG